MSQPTNTPLVPAQSDTARREEAMLAFWAEHDIFHKSITQPAGADPIGEYVFYDGPPFATGLPHYGHLLAGTIKDAVPRFWTMNGYRVDRQWGWDCHGLPLENLIEKELGLATKRDIEAFGVQNFNERARAAVLRYADDWRQTVPRMGRFVDMADDYQTMDPQYTESVWWVFKTLHDKGLVYEGFKSMHLCPRCGTTLSNFEVNLGYHDIKDIAVTVKLPLLDDAGEPTDTSLLVWTTTPWTLPGNLAAAVHQDYTYVTVRAATETGSEQYIVAKERLAQLGDIAYEVVSEQSGSELVGRRYQPPFPWLAEQDFDGKDNAWQIYHADYVELGEEGTGAVHLAPAYGEEDMELAKAHGVPIYHHVDEAGHFKDFVTDFAGQLVKPKDDDDAGVVHLDGDIMVVKALKANGTLFKKENITHSYPHCWRCDTPLLNYATTSWFVSVSTFRDQLTAANDTVHWVPGHVGANRFGKWLEGARDWAVSRQRYWGAPLPVWRNPETSEHHVLGSLAELQDFVPKSGNQYLLMRHGESESNVAGVVSARADTDDPITERGEEQVRAAAADLPPIDRIIHSGFVRTRQSAELVAAQLGIAPERVTADSRIRELDIGAVYEGKTWNEYGDEFSTFAERYTKRPDGGIENRRDVQIRTGEFLFELERTYKNETVLIVGHGGSLAGLQHVAVGWTPAQIEAHHATTEQFYFANAEVRELAFTPYPHNDHLELDFHRPYIDQIDLFEGETKLERVSDVFDCWFESGSMPYAQHHYPFALDEATFQTNHFPANFIAESIDQTRGWFYSLMVLGVALFGEAPYRNVVTNGLVLAEDGRKMSKSLQNYPDPLELVATYGADSMRFYLLSSSIIRGEDLNFSESEVAELQRKNVGRLHNVLNLYEQCADGTAAKSTSEYVLDQWIVARTNEVVRDVTAGYKNYELDKATRPITEFIDDLSVWYVRRSRDRLKHEEAAVREPALATLRWTLHTLAHVLAPVMPFYAEHLFQATRSDSDPESVHLAKWPEAGAVDADVLEAMRTVRTIVTAALEARTAAGLKVRQPLASVAVRDPLPATADIGALQEIIADEVNVKEVTFDSTLSTAVALDTALTDELRAEGAVREILRAVQGQRKQLGLAPSDRITLQVDTPTAELLAPYTNTVTRTVGASEIVTVEALNEATPVSVGDTTYRFAIVV